MREERTTPSRGRMIENMRRGPATKPGKPILGQSRIFAGFLKRSPDTATADDLRAYQLHMTNGGVTPP